MIGKTAFLASRVLLLLLVLVAGLLAAEILWFGGVVSLDAGLLEWGTWKHYLPLLFGLVLAVLCLVGLKYVFRPPAQRSRYWIVLVLLLVIVGLASFL